MKVKDLQEAVSLSNQRERIVPLLAYLRGTQSGLDQTLCSPATLSVLELYFSGRSSMSLRDLALGSGCHVDVIGRAVVEAVTHVFQDRLEQMEDRLQELGVEIGPASPP